MEDKNRQNTLLLTVIAVATLLVAIVGATFAYFTASISGNDISTPMNVSAANLTINFADGSATLRLRDKDGKVEPTRGVTENNVTTYSSLISKTFTLTGTNTTGQGTTAPNSGMRMPYQLYLIVTENTFMLTNTVTTTSLSYKLSHSTGTEGFIPDSTVYAPIAYKAIMDGENDVTIAQAKAGKTNLGNAVQTTPLQKVTVYNDDSTVAINETGLLLGNGYFRAGANGEVHTYTLDIYFIDDNTNQDYDTTSNFKGYIAVSAGDIGTAIDNNFADSNPANPANPVQP